MKSISIKLKITLWFTAFLIILSAVIMSFIGVLANSTASNELRSVLVELVDENVDEVDYDDGEVEIDDDFVSFKNGIYCAVFDEWGEKISGYLPYSELEDVPLTDMEIQTITISGETYVIYDRLVTFKKHDDLWVRGVVLESSNPLASSAVYSSVLVALPLLVVLAAVGGYLIARHSLRPIRQISSTAEAIGKSGDLTKRIPMSDSGDELHQLAGTFNRMFDRLQANFEAERSFTSDASHELRTPVTTILAQCEYALEDANGEQELYESITAIQKQGRRMSKLIESLLQFTRIEQRTEEMVLQRLDFSELVESICKEYGEMGGKNIALSCEAEADIAIKGDAGLLTRLLGNLIGNAYRYGREDGQVLVSLKRDGEYAALAVADNGIGIAEDEIPRIWTRFYKVDKSRSHSNTVGVGLGLAMVKQIAELHGGTVNVESEIGEGSTFTAIFKIEP